MVIGQLVVRLTYDGRSVQGPLDRRCWFLLDYAYYGNTISTPQIVVAALPGMTTAEAPFLGSSVPDPAEFARPVRDAAAHRRRLRPPDQAAAPRGRRLRGHQADRS